MNPSQTSPEQRQLARLALMLLDHLGVAGLPCDDIEEHYLCGLITPPELALYAVTLGRPPTGPASALHRDVSGRLVRLREDADTAPVPRLRGLAENDRSLVLPCQHPPLPSSP